MKRQYLFATATAMVVSVALSSPAALTAEPSPTTDPGFVPQSGQINPGHAPAPWSATASLPQDKQPSQEQARAALMMPDPVGVVSPGQAQVAAQTSEQSTTGAGSLAAETQSGSGPIGSTVQTAPAKYSPRNDLLDHLPMMAWPMRLDEQQRQQIYQAVMAEKSQPASNAEALKPASALSDEQARDMHPVPQSLASIEALQGLNYVKAKDKIFLVRPATRTVVDEIVM
jgi:hypothetical protein